jgi:hypothetical protein
MKGHRGSKNLHRAGTRLRIVSLAANAQLDLRARSPGATPLPATVQSVFHPARNLMICLAWLRLFQKIVPGNYVFSQKAFGFGR